MENESQKQPWALIAIAALSLALAAVALVVAFGAKDTSDEAAQEASVAKVQIELSNLVDRLGIAEKGLKGDAQVANGQAQRATRESRDAAINLSNRIDRLERQIPKLNKTAKQTAVLTKRFNQVSAGAGQSGGKSAP